MSKAPRVTIEELIEALSNLIASLEPEWADQKPELARAVVRATDALAKARGEQS